MSDQPSATQCSFSFPENSPDRWVPEAVRHLREGIRAGRPWHQVLLEAMGTWVLPEEEWQGRRYRYIILGEAFDWLLLAERLCAELDGMVSAEEREELLFRGRFPADTSLAEFKHRIGQNKYRGILNFWYGVVVEEALQLAVEDEVRKEQRASGRSGSDDLVEVAYQRLYNDTRVSLLRQFRTEMSYPLRGPLSLTQAKEFTYWLFKFRLKLWDPARVASDTRKALKRLQQLRGSSSPI